MQTFSKKPEYWWCVVLAVLMFFSFYFAIGSYPLFDNNEGIYASIAKYMLSHKDFIIPHLNCVPYIEKPPLLYWLLAGSYSVFGLNAFAARLVTATCAFLTGLAILFFSKKINQQKLGFYSALIFVSSIGISIIARMVYFDMLFTLLIALSLFSLFYWYEYDKPLLLRAFYGFLGLAVLTKGLVAIVLILGSFGLFLLLEKNLKQTLKLIDPIGIALFLAIVLPWHVAAVVQHKDFFKHYIIEEHFLRFLNLREPHDYYNGPIYYYLPRIIIYLLPWSFFIPITFLRFEDYEAHQKKLLRFAWSWVLIPLLFFSFSSAKANYYMIVSVPALAMIIAIKIISLTSKPLAKTFNVWSFLLLFTMGLMLAVGYYTFFKVNIVAFTAIYAFCLAILSLFLALRRELIMLMIASLIIPLIFIMVSYIELIKNNISTFEAGIYLDREAKDKPIYLYQDFDNISAMAFYTSSCFTIIDSTSNDLYYGKSLPEGQKQFIDKKEFLANLKQKSYIVVPTKKLAQFYQEMKPAKFSLQKEFNLVAVVSG
jgi:4-amino-4-deoxy-L-arabinose transferase-like glycosyltransferase